MWSFNVSLKREETKRKISQMFDYVNFHCLTREEWIFTWIVCSNGIERCAGLWADDNFWPRSCQWGEAKRGQKALSQLQTSAWCRRHQSGATDTSSERAAGKRQGDDGLSLCLSLSSSHPSLPLPPLLLLQPGPAVSGSMLRHCTLSHTLTGEPGRRGVDREIRILVTVEWLGHVWGWGEDSRKKREEIWDK